MRLITFLSDFGSNSSYVSQMKGAALSITDATIVDITHDITPHNIREGAFVLSASISFFPTGSVHVAVVDPGVGTDRRGIVITTHSQILIGPDNGLLIPAARKLGDFTVYEITNTNLMLKSISNTFHGRDIFSPIAAHILNGVLFEQIGPIITDFVDLDFGNSEINDKAAKGKVIYIDSFGNIITNIDGLRLSNVLNFDKKVTIFIGKKNLRTQLVRSYNFVKKSEVLATIGSSNLLEIAINQGNAAKKLGIKPNDDIKILFS
ncbi:MAG: S-adenosyl-l-methionine hydroxide adenosyltransferase family protein [Thermoplasmatales archaeon]|nr:MAG: S-adenosyl-l-methionine hydroxide adenosyltransferase family protein [Thermoplasmatales archaeon]